MAHLLLILIPLNLIRRTDVDRLENPLLDGRRYSSRP
jgi:hypothetical protein